MPSESAYRARWIIPPAEEPLADATLILAGDVIADITTKQVPGAVELGSVALVPGLVNAHVHLEFSHLKRPIAPATSFTDWLRTVIRTRRTEESPEAAIAAGIEEAVRTQTTALGEIATSPLSVDLLSESDLTGVVFQEVIGITEERAREKAGELDQLLSASPQEHERFQLGLSPHAPFSVSPELLQTIVETSQTAGCPLAVHLAENKSERELIGKCQGEFRTFLEEMNLWPGDVWQDFRTIVDYLRLLAEAPSCLVIHGNDLQDEEIEFLGTQPQMTVVYCPRTHAYFGHDRHPLPKLLERGVRVALGTDGRSSNPDLDLWRESKFVRKTYPELSPRTVLNLATTNGAEALGLSSNGLTVGEPARWSAIELDESSRETDPWKLLFGD
jgi:cytosine/adenosine deaminase-related metal-dependent hydrolase